MARLSQVRNTKRKKNYLVEKATDELLLGDMFIKCVNSHLIDITKNHTIIVSNTRVSKDITGPDNSECAEFDGKTTNINIEENGTFNLGLNDFTIDWWEYKFSLPNPNHANIPTTQYSFYKNSPDKNKPFIIKNSDHKSIYLSSNGKDWDIADDKYMGRISENLWTHWAITRSNNNFYTFKHGIPKNRWTSKLVLNSSDGFLTVGSGLTTNHFYGCITNYRFVKGQALWV
ncbi:MAG: hypothetical protein DRI84_05525, partial [Bacteroidetes bacterium]